MPSSEQTAGQPKAILCDVKGLAKMLSVDVAALLRDLDAGKLLAPVIVGGEPRWRIAEVEGWVEAGLPDRATWDRRTIKPRTLPARRMPDRQATTASPTYDNFRIPKPGKSVFAWAKAMEKFFNTTLVEGMGRDGESKGWGKQFADWNEQQVNRICMKVVAYLRELPAYRGQFERLFPCAGAGGDKQPRPPQGLTAGPAVPPWEDTKPD